MITYQRTEDDEPQPVDQDGRLPDGTQVIFFNDGVMRFDAGTFSGAEPFYVDEGEARTRCGQYPEDEVFGCTDVCYTGTGEAR